MHAGLRPLLVSPPSTLLQPEMRAVARVAELVAALASRRVSSLRSLAAQWRQQPNFLRAEVAAWLPRTKHAQLVGQVWPALVAEAVQLQVGVVGRVVSC